MEMTWRRADEPRSRRGAAPLLVAALAGLVAVGGWWAVRGETTSALPTRTAEAGDVTVKATPVAIGPGGAVFTITLVAESFNLDFAMEEVAHLTVDGTDWRPATWDRGLPSAHGRDGRLEFGAGGSARHRAVLRMDGLPTTVTCDSSDGG
jgi:hypothetical protein